MTIMVMTNVFCFLFFLLAKNNCGDDNHGDDNHGDDNGDEVVNNNDKNETRLRPLRKKEMAPVTILGWKGWRRGFVDHDCGFL